MDKSRIEKILERCTPDEKVRVTAFYNASIEKLREFQADKSASALRDLEAADAALARLVSDIEARFYPAEPPLKNLTAAVQHLQDQGYKIAKSKIYQDAKAGLLRVQPDRTVLRADLDSYVLRAGLEKVAAADVGGRIEREQAEKLELENRKLRKQVEKLEWELDRDRGKYLLKDDVRTEQALKIASLDAGAKHWIRTTAADLIYAVGGDPGKERVLINLFEARFSELLDEMGRMDELRIEIKRQPTVDRHARQAEQPQAEAPG